MSRRSFIPSTVARAAAGTLAVVGLIAGGIGGAAQVKGSEFLHGLRVAGPAGDSASIPPPPSGEAERTLTTDFVWADGRPVIATVLDGELARRVTPEEISDRYGAESIKSDHTLLGVLADGRALTLDTVWPMVVGRGKEKDAYYGAHDQRARGVPAIDAWTLPSTGTTIYGVVKQSGGLALYSSKGPGKTIVGPLSLPGEQAQALDEGQQVMRTSPGVRPVAVFNGRVYWDRLSSDGEDGARHREVVSRPLTGGFVRVELAKASHPQAVPGGIAVLTESDRVLGTGFTYDGARMLGGQRLVSAVPNEAGTTPCCDGTWRSAQLGGRLVVVPHAYGDGQLVMDTQARKAWWVSSPKGQAVLPAVLTNSRAVWSWTGTGEHRGMATNRIAILDAGSGQLRTLRPTNRVAAWAVAGSALAWSTQPDDAFEGFAAQLLY